MRQLLIKIFLFIQTLYYFIKNKLVKYDSVLIFKNNNIYDYTFKINFYLLLKSIGIELNWMCDEICDENTVARVDDGKYYRIFDIKQNANLLSSIIYHANKEILHSTVSIMSLTINGMNINVRKYGNIKLKEVCYFECNKVKSVEIMDDSFDTHEINYELNKDNYLNGLNY